jgi:hypothetical protein
MARINQKGVSKSNFSRKLKFSGLDAPASAKVCCISKFCYQKTNFSCLAAKKGTDFLKRFSVIGRFSGR